MPSESTQPERIILLPPTHEQTTPSFHVEGGLAEDFVTFLKLKGHSPWQPPETLDKKGPDGRQLVEVTLEANTPLSALEQLQKEFLATRR